MFLVKHKPEKTFMEKQINIKICIDYVKIYKFS